MNNVFSGLKGRVETVPLLLAVSVLCVGLVYILGYVYLVPYPGFNYDGTWRVDSLYTECSTASMEASEWCTQTAGSLQPGDHILRIVEGDGSTLTFEEYEADHFVVPFAGLSPGENVTLVVERNKEILEVVWPIQGPMEFGPFRRLAALILFIPFWLAGTIALLFFRPRSARWYLLILFNYLTGLWLTIGSISVSQVLASSAILIMISWILMPIYLHLHLLISRDTLNRTERNVLIALYGFALLMGLLESVQILYVQSYYIALLIGMGGSIVILAARLLQSSNSSSRAATMLMVVGILIAIVPGIVFWLVPRMVQSDAGSSVMVTYLATLTLPVLPLFYTYALFKHRMGDLEVRANRALTLYSFLILYATAFVFAFVIVSQQVNFDARVLIFSLIFSIVFLLLAIVVRPPFEAYLNRLAYGTTYEPEKIVQQFANEIPRALNRENLTQLLTNQVMPSLLIRQSALLWFTEPENPVVYQESPDTPIESIEDEQIELLQQAAGRYRNPEQALPEPFDWVRVAVLIELDGQPVGVWLLGRRDPDDYYPQSDVELLTTLGSQVGVALETARLFAIQQQRTRELEEAYFELSRANRLQNDFIRNISHELRTPLTAISGYTDLLLDGDAGEMDSAQSELLEIVASNSHNLIQMINDIITVQQTRLHQEEGEALDIVSLAGSAVRNAQLLADKDSAWRSRPHNLTLTSDPDLAPVWASSTQLGQVFANLLQNAVKFSPDGGKIEVTVWQGTYRFCSGDDAKRTMDSTPHRNGTNSEEEAEKPAVFVSISDEGIGIADDELENIWLDFYQIDGSATRRFGGTGLGLALVRDIVEGYGGQVWVDNKQELGSTFTLVLPAHLPTSISEPSVSHSN